MPISARLALASLFAVVCTIVFLKFTLHFASHAQAMQYAPTKGCSMVLHNQRG